MKSAAFLLFTKMIVRDGGIESSKSYKHSRFRDSSANIILSKVSTLSAPSLDRKGLPFVSR